MRSARRTHRQLWRTRMNNLGQTALAMVLFLTGCATEDGSVGAEGSRFNLNRCFGERTQCGNTAPTAVIDAGSTSECTAPVDDDLKFEFERNFESELCTDIFACQFILQRIAIAPDE